eukprot:TRINITY_DN18_c0_g2_i11.p1 TRINITY_DN18_c0_g2~~TRINITY_DN18_c0_g2_i11.p1  ORF type:complete len:361 (+),score=31.76 TRINITY_DN18_c0_g2_i11:689-1771(+)
MSTDQKITTHESLPFNDPLLNPLVEEMDQLTPSLPSKSSQHIIPGISGQQFLQRYKDQLFEYFIVVGLSKEIKINKNGTNPPQILFTYPPTKRFDLKVVHFCFPEGIKISIQNNQGNNLNEIYFNQSYLHSNDHLHIFLLNGPDQFYYGVCVTRKEILRELPTFIDNTKPSLREQFHVAPRCYCILSKYPFFSIHFEVIFTILTQERINRVQREYSSTSALSNIDITHPLQSDYIEIQEKFNNYNSLEAILDVVSIYPPAPGLNIKIDFPNFLKTLTLHSPPGDGEAKLLSDWCYYSIFSLLSLQNVIFLLSCLLQERQIILHSRNLCILSLSVLSIIPLLRPLVWQGLCIPILPLNMLV